MNPATRRWLAIGLKALAVLVWIGAFAVLFPFRHDFAQPTTAAILIVVIGMLIYTAGRIVDRIPPKG